MKLERVLLAAGFALTIGISGLMGCGDLMKDGKSPLNQSSQTLTDDTNDGVGLGIEVNAEQSIAFGYWRGYGIDPDVKSGRVYDFLINRLERLVERAGGNASRQTQFSAIRLVLKNPEGCRYNYCERNFSVGMEIQYWKGNEMVEWAYVNVPFVDGNQIADVEKRLAWGVDAVFADLLANVGGHIETPFF